MWTAVVTAVMLAVLGFAGAAQSQSPSIDLDRGFTLRAGDSAVLSDGTLRIGFDRVISDSRCAKGAQCVWAGDAVARVWLQRGSGPKEVRELHTAPGPSQAATAFEHELRLVRLDPEAPTGKAPTRAGDVATLLLSRTATTAPER